jgi:hypothetical protein
MSAQVELENAMVQYSVDFVSRPSLFDFARTEIGRIPLDFGYYVLSGLDHQSAIAKLKHVISEKSESEKVLCEFRMNFTFFLVTVVKAKYLLASGSPIFSAEIFELFSYAGTIFRNSIAPNFETANKQAEEGSFSSDNVQDFIIKEICPKLGMPLSSAHMKIIFDIRPVDAVAASRTNKRGRNALSGVACAICDSQSDYPSENDPACVFCNSRVHLTCTSLTKIPIAYVCDVCEKDPNAKKAKPIKPKKTLEPAPVPTETVNLRPKVKPWARDESLKVETEQTVDSKLKQHALALEKDLIKICGRSEQKAWIREFQTKLFTRKERGKAECPIICFQGAPGTGRRLFAKVMAQIFYRCGLVSRDFYVELTSLEKVDFSALRSSTVVIAVEMETLAQSLNEIQRLRESNTPVIILASDSLQLRFQDVETLQFTTYSTVEISAIFLKMLQFTGGAPRKNAIKHDKLEGFFKLFTKDCIQKYNGHISDRVFHQVDMAIARRLVERPDSDLDSLTEGDLFSAIRLAKSTLV